jgi:predicted GNAT superfamily acetyltransferase
VPRDIEQTRGADPALAQRWRVAVRETLTTLVDAGARIDGFDRAGSYVVRRGR